MTCLHRFLDYHTEGIFPSWNIKYLFIGTFNPSWNKPGNNADYFYGRSNYFWLLITRFLLEDSLKESSISEKVTFCKRNFIGFTDLIKKIEDVNYDNPIHKERILSFKDSDLLTFEDNLNFNTQEIIDYINNNNQIERVYFTLLGNNVGAITTAINQIENHCQEMEPPIPTYRLHTHTGQGLGHGRPRENRLTNKWFENGLCHINENFNPNNFPYELE